MGWEKFHWQQLPGDSRVGGGSLKRRENGKSGASFVILHAEIG